MKFFPQGPTDNISSVVQIVACCSTGAELSYVPMMVQFDNMSVWNVTF